MTDWRGRVCLVTGASRGVGRAIAVALGARGATVVVNYRRQAEAAAETVRALEAAGGRAFAIAADVADPAALDALFAEVREREGHLDVLIHNAAASSFKPILETHRGTLDKSLAISYHALFELLQRAVPLMTGGGNFLAISGWDAHAIVDGHGLLASLKAATETFVAYAGAELAAQGIVSIGLAPGVVETDSFAAYEAAQPGRIAQWRELAPFGRFARPEEIAEIAVFLCSREALWINGRTVLADGGHALMTSPVAAGRSDG